MRKRDAPSDAQLFNPTRRKLLQAGAAGVTAAFGAGAAALSAREQQAPPTTAPPQGPPPLIPAVPPAAAGFIDPATLTAETWCEAWVWRPADWPGQALDLNVVERNEPDEGALAGSGVSRAVQFRRHQSGADDPRARRRHASHPAAQSARRRTSARCGSARAPIRCRCRPPSRSSSSAKSRRRRASRFRQQPDPAFNLLATSRRARRDSCAVKIDGRPLHDRASRTPSTGRVSPTSTRTACTCRPDANAGRGTESDNVLVRLLSRDDWAMRQEDGRRGVRDMKPHEYVGHVDYEFVLGHVQRAAMQRAGRPPQARPAGHALVSPARARLDARSGVRRHGRLPHRRRRRGRRDQHGDDGRARIRIRRRRPARTTIASGSSSFSA